MESTIGYIMKRKKVNRFNAIHEPVVDGHKSEIGHFITAEPGNAQPYERSYLTSPKFTITSPTAKVYFMTYIYTHEDDTDAEIALDAIDHMFRFIVS